MDHNSSSMKDNHIFFSSSINVAEICKPLLNYGIIYFTYTRSYKDGGRIYLTTHPKILSGYIKNKSYLIGNCEGKPTSYTSQTILWSTLPEQEVFNKNARKYGVDHGIFIFESKIDYCEIYGFATTKENYFINNTYLNKLEQLKKFISYFKDKASDILNKSERSRIILPFNNIQLPCNDNENDIDLEKILFIRNQNFYLSQRQSECAKLLIKGKTIKQIAEHTKLSHRTIEDYVNIIKKKLNCRNKYELIIKLMNLE